MTLKLSTLSVVNAGQYSEDGTITSGLAEPASNTSHDGGEIDGILDSVVYSIIASTTTNTFDGGTI